MDLTVVLNLEYARNPSNLFFRVSHLQLVAVEEVIMM
jgi:hypothetical protein